MATDIFVRRAKASDIPADRDVLVPTSRESDTWLKGVPFADNLKCKVTRPRNKRHHDKLFACAGLIAENLDFVVTARQIVAGYQQFAGLGHDADRRHRDRRDPGRYRVRWHRLHQDPRRVLDRPATR